MLVVLKIFQHKSILVPRFKNSTNLISNCSNKVSRIARSQF